MKKRIGLFLLLIAVTAGTAFAAEFNVIYRVQYKNKDGSWVYSTNQNQVSNVSGTLISSEEAAKNHVRKELGAKKGQDTWVAKNLIDPKAGDLNCRVEWVLVEKIEKQKVEKAPKEKKSWAEKNIPPLKLKN